MQMILPNRYLLLIDYFFYFNSNELVIYIFRSLSSMNLPGSLQALENPGGIPEDIMRKVQQFRNDVRFIKFIITIILTCY